MESSIILNKVFLLRMLMYARRSVQITFLPSNYKKWPLKIDTKIVFVTKTCNIKSSRISGMH